MRPYHVLLAPVPARSHEQVFGFARPVMAVVVISDPNRAPERPQRRSRAYSV